MLGTEFESKQQCPSSQIPHATSPPALWEAYRLQQMKIQQEPVNRQEPVEKVQAPETAKNMKSLFESGNIPDLHGVVKTVDVERDLQIPGSGVFENTPTRLEGVVRSDEVYVQEGEEVMSGSTKSRLDDYLEKSKNKFVINRKPVHVAEDEGKVLENTPIKRDDVIREGDILEPVESLPKEGQATILKHQWANMKEEFVKDNKPIQLVERENEQHVFENQPERRQDVLREEDLLEDGGLKIGLTSNMKNYWVNYKDTEIYARDRPIDLPGPEAPTGILENEPIRLEGVVREEDSTDEIAAIEKGKAKNLVNRWQSIDERFQGKGAFDLQNELAAGKEAGVFENQPDVLREGVIKCDEAVQEVMTKEGVAKQMNERFHDTEFWNPKIQKGAPVMDLAEGPGVHENIPSALDPEVIRCSVDSELISEIRRQQSGATANLVGKWVRNDVEGADLLMPDKSYFHDPRILLEKEKAKDAGIYENKPDVRKDVYREDDDQLEMIPAQKAKSLKQLWMKMGEETPKETGVPKQIRFTPPREKSPPGMDNGFTSVEHINLNQY